MAFIHYSSFDGFDKTFAAGILFFISCKLLGRSYVHASLMSWTPSTIKPNGLISCTGFFVLLAMAVYTGVTVNYYGKRYGSWRFSWSYIMGWVAVVLTFFSGMNPIMLKNENVPHSHVHILLLIICLFSPRYLLHVCLSDARMPKKFELTLTCQRLQHTRTHTSALVHNIWPRGTNTPMNFPTSSWYWWISKINEKMIHLLSVLSLYMNKT